nr:hypothetical protein [uncultured Mucilaginibacter sp.]
MVAVVTSTIKTAEGKSYYSYTQRIEQTIATLQSLQQAGFDEIYLVDNSQQLDMDQLRLLLKEYAPVHVFHTNQYQFNNKGINELLMLLCICPHLPADQPIFKISGRYSANAAFKKPEFVDLAVKGYHFSNKTGTISTRGYWVKNAALFEDFLNATLREVFAYPERIVGLGSLIYKVKNMFGAQCKPLNISIEFAAANILKRSKYSASFLNELNIEGLVAGSDREEKIIE